MYNGNAKWLLWTAGIIATFIITALTCMANSIIENDRIRANEDLRIEREARCDRAMLATQTQKQYSEIIQRLSRIETKLEK